MGSVIKQMQDSSLFPLDVYSMHTWCICVGYILEL